MALEWFGHQEAGLFGLLLLVVRDLSKTQRVKVHCKVCIEPSGPISSWHLHVRILWFQEHQAPRSISTPPWMGHLSIPGLPLHQICQYPFIHLGGERHNGSEVTCPRMQHNVPNQGLKPSLLNLEAITLTMQRPPRLHS